MPKPKIEIIYTNNDILVVNKPASISVTKDRTGIAELKDILSGQLGSETTDKLRLVHRLDKDTSGVMVLAKNAQTQAKLSSFFEKKQIKKTYLAIVTGVVIDKAGTIQAALTRNHKDTNLMRIAAKKGKDAITEWKLLADFGLFSLLVVKPLTGRTHQIRVHLAHIGLPLAIDPSYGSNRPIFLSDLKADYRLGKGQTEKPLIERLTLHAYQIEFPKPQQNMPESFIAPLDKKFAATLKMLTKHNPKGLDAFTNQDDFSKIINNQSL